MCIKKAPFGASFDSIHQELLKQLRSKLAQIHAPVSPGMSAFTFYVGVRHLHPLQFVQVLLVGFVEEVRFAYGDPVQFVPIVLLSL